MSSAYTVPILLGLLVAALVTLVAWGLVLVRNQQTDDLPVTTRDGLLLGLLMLAAVTLGVFLTYAFLRIGF